MTQYMMCVENIEDEDEDEDWDIRLGFDEEFNGILADN